jgi:hypothetical protein
MATKIQVRRGTKAQVLATVFDAGEPFFCVDTGECGFGDGLTAGGAFCMMKKELSLPVDVGQGSVAVDLTALGLVNPPSNVVPVLFKADGTKATISAEPRLDGLTAQNVNVDFTGDTPDNTYVLKVTVIL